MRVCAYHHRRVQQDAALDARALDGGEVVPIIGGLVDRARGRVVVTKHDEQAEGESCEEWRSEGGT